MTGGSYQAGSEGASRASLQTSMRQLSSRVPAGLLGFAILFVISTKIFAYVEQHAGIGYLAVIWLILFFVTLFLCLIYSVIATVFLVRRHYTRFLSALSGAIILIGSLAFGRALSAATFSLIDNLRFHVERSHYEKIISDRLRVAAGPALVFIDWGSGGALATNFFYSLVYDPSDQIGFEGPRPAWWTEAASAQYPILFAKNCSSSSYRITGHFFSVTTVCQ